MTYEQLTLALDNFLIKFFIILISSFICWYFINKISYKRD